MTQGTSWGTDAYPVAEPGKRPRDFGKGRICACCEGPLMRYRPPTRVGNARVLLCGGPNCTPGDWRGKTGQKPPRVKRSRPGPPEGSFLPGLSGARKRAGLGRRELAGRIGRSYSAVANAERTSARASERFASLLARELGVSVADLTFKAEEGAA